MYTASVPQVSKMLRHLEFWLEKAEQHAAAQNFDVCTLLGARLAPDMLPLSYQIQATCDNAKFIGARLAGQAPPPHADTEQTVAELRERIRWTLGYLESITAQDFEGAAERLVQLGFLPEGKRIVGHVYLNQLALPNFYFHLTTTYALLRQSGVDIGKSDFLGAVPQVDAS